MVTGQGRRHTRLHLSLALIGVVLVQLVVGLSAAAQLQSPRW